MDPFFPLCLATVKIHVHIFFNIDSNPILLFLYPNDIFKVHLFRGFKKCIFRVLYIYIYILSHLHFIYVVTDLEDGELIHGENFNLFAAMSALEVISHSYV